MKKITFKALGIVFVALAALAVGFYVYSKQSKDIVIDRHLTSEQKKAYTDRLDESKKLLSQLDKSSKAYKEQEAQLHLNNGQLYFGLGRVTDALKEFEIALNFDRTNYNIYVSKALVQTEIKDLEGAYNTYKEGLSAVPSIADVWIRLIDLRKTMNASNEEIEKLYEDALKKTSRHADILTHKAVYEEQQGNTKEALSLWKEALVQYPTNEGYKNEVARLSK